MQDATHRIKRFPSQQVRWRGIAQKGIEQNGVIAVGGAIDSMPDIGRHPSEPFRLATKILFRHRRDRRVDFDDIDPDAFASQLRQCDWGQISAFEIFLRSIIYQ